MCDDMSAPFTFLKARCWALSHDHLVFFFSNWCKGANHIDECGKNMLQNWDVYWGLGAAASAQTLSGEGWMPSAEIMYLRHSTDGSIKAHLLFFSRSSASSSQLRISFNSWRCSSTVIPVRRMSSKYTETWSNTCRMPSMAHCTISGTDEILNSRQLNWYNLLWVLTVTNFYEASSKGSCW